jgi:hypothetical protein
VRIWFTWMFWHDNQHLMMKKSFLSVIVKKHSSLFLPEHQWPEILWHVRIPFAWMFWHANQHLMMKRSLFFKKATTKQNISRVRKKLSWFEKLDNGRKDFEPQWSKTRALVIKLHKAVISVWKDYLPELDQVY